MPFSRAASSPVPIHEPSRAERLAEELELQSVGDDDNHWIVHVLGIHNDGQHLWVQIAPNAEGTQSIVLRMSMTATARHALAALSSLSLASLSSARVVPVMCAV